MSKQLTTDLDAMQAQREELAAALAITDSRHALKGAIRDATEAQLKKLDQQILRMRGKKVALPDGVLVGVGDKFYTYRPGHRPYSYRSGATTEWKPPVITEHTVTAVSPSGKIAVNKIDRYNRPDYKDPSGVGWGSYSSSRAFGTQEAAIAACIRSAEDDVRRARKDVEAAQAKLVDAEEDLANTVVTLRPLEHAAAMMNDAAAMISDATREALR